MKKILISVLIVLLLILAYFMIWQGINIGFIKIEGIKDIKSASASLDEDINKANELSNQKYPSEQEGLEEAIRKLKISKQEYENKVAYNTNETTLGAIEVKTYKIHYLWAKLGNYKKDRNVRSLGLDLKTTQTSDIYDLQFTVVGEYSSIIEFLYDIEDDEELNFEIKDFIMQPYTQTTTTTVTDVDKNNKSTEKVNPYDTITEITTTGGTANKNSNTITSTTQNQTNNNNTTINNTQNQTNNNTANSSSSTSKEIIYDPKWVQATFKIENVGITLD